MKKVTNIPLALLTVVVLLQSCCKKKEEISDLYHDYKMPKEMLDYGYFKPGTYWIYQDSISGAIDSVWVYDTYYLIDTLSEGNPYGLPKGIYDDFEIKTTSSYFNADYYYWSNSSRVTNDNFYQIRREKITVTNVTETIVVIYPIQIGKELGLLGNIISIYNFIDDFLSNTLSFSNVILISQTQDQTEDNLLTYFFHAQNVGIIKKQIPSRNENWNLIRYNIVQ